MTAEKIISILPYTEPFLFVDHLQQIDEEGVVGYYTYPSDSYFYKGHFVDNPVTPGVILTETMAQIGLVCLGLFLMQEQITDETKLPEMVMVSNETDYFLPVFPGEKVKVVSRKEYFRFGKLKCQVTLYNERDEMVCRGKIAGMISRKPLTSNEKDE